MCGRYAIHGPKSRSDPALDDLELWGLSLPVPRNLDARPTQRMPILRIDEAGAPELALARWGLIPAWSTDGPAQRYSTFNARSEEAARKPAFRMPWRSRRCLVPMSGWYEWRDEGGPKKQRYYAHLDADALLTVAGLWDRWADRQSGEVIESFTVLTCAAAEPIAWLHERMPVVLDESAARMWMVPDAPGNSLQALCIPRAAGVVVDVVAGPIP